jgi:hypothetical protein
MNQRFFTLTRAWNNDCHISTNSWNPTFNVSRSVSPKWISSPSCFLEMKSLVITIEEIKATLSYMTCISYSVKSQKVKKCCHSGAKEEKVCEKCKIWEEKGEPLHPIPLLKNCLEPEAPRQWNGFCFYEIKRKSWCLWKPECSYGRSGRWGLNFLSITF